MFTSLKRFFLVGLFVLVSAGAAEAAIIVYEATWSGEEFGNTATATAFITVNTGFLDNPGDNDCFFGDPGCAITNVVLTVSDASVGNGTFTTSDFDDYFFNWNTALNLFANLFGQPQDVGGPWGTHEGQPGFVEEAHDFNLFADFGSGAPDGTFFFELTTAEGDGDSMYLTSFNPIEVQAPEPATLLLLGAGVGAAAVRRRLKTHV
jgi:hypothetical protein